MAASSASPTPALVHRPPSKAGTASPPPSAEAVSGRVAPNMELAAIFLALCSSFILWRQEMSENEKKNKKQNKKKSSTKCRNLFQAPETKIVAKTNPRRFRDRPQARMVLWVIVYIVVHIAGDSWSARAGVDDFDFHRYPPSPKKTLSGVRGGLSSHLRPPALPGAVINGPVNAGLITRKGGEWR